jgi:hypothetical protein
MFLRRKLPAKQLNYLRNQIGRELQDRLLDIKYPLKTMLSVDYPLESDLKTTLTRWDNLPSEGAFDCVTTQSLHWIEDLEGYLAQLYRLTARNGCFLGCILGGDTLYELRVSMQLAELERTGGISPHVSPMVLPKDMGALLTRAGYSLLTVDVDEIVVNYPSMCTSID